MTTTLHQRARLFVHSYCIQMLEGTLCFHMRSKIEHQNIDLGIRKGWMDQVTEQYLDTVPGQYGTVFFIFTFHYKYLPLFVFQALSVCII